MNSSISNDDKKQFIRWFLKNYQLKKREGVWLLNYLLTSEQLLSRVRFTEDIRYCPRAIVMSTVDTTLIPFRFYQNQSMTIEAEKAFIDLKMVTDQPMYIQLNFGAAVPHPLYLAVLEQNPYVSIPKPIQEQDRELANDVMLKSQLLFQEKFLLNLIDKALDEGDEESFHHYVQQLKAIKRT